MIIFIISFDVEIKRIKFNGDYIDVYKPKVEGKFPFILFSGGMNSPSRRYESFGKFLASNGYVVIIPDYKGWFFLTLIPFKILKILDNLNEIDSSIENRGCLGGHSLGAYYSLLVSYKRNFIKCVFVFSPPALFLNYNKIKIPVLIFSGTNDEITKFEYNQKIIYESLKTKKKLIVIKGGNHNGYMDRWDFVEKITDGYLGIKHEEQLKIVRDSVLVFLKDNL
ncbi:MAG: alpha/beta hydrolase [candidate division WOR-3 bacterium]